MTEIHIKSSDVREVLRRAQEDSAIPVPDDGGIGGLDEAIDSFAATANRIADRLIEAIKQNREQAEALELALAALKSFDCDVIRDGMVYEIASVIIPRIEAVLAKAKP